MGGTRLESIMALPSNTIPIDGGGFETTSSLTALSRELVRLDANCKHLSQKLSVHFKLVC